MSYFSFCHLIPVFEADDSNRQFILIHNKSHFSSIPHKLYKYIEQNNTNTT